MLREFPVQGRMGERVDPAGRALHPPPPVRDAATVMLVRDGRRGLEVFTFRRVPGMAFAPGMLVFPGGRVDPADADALPGPGGAVLAAAVRETFEECGVLLARDGAGRAPDAGELASPAWEEARTGLAAGRVALREVLDGVGLTAAAGELKVWARWVTPEFESRRYDTWFFAARVPEGQEARDLGGEGELAAWLSPAVALERHAAGELPMLPPTLVCLEELAACATVADVLRAPRASRGPIVPWVARGDDGGLVLRAELDGPGGASATAPGGAP